MMHIQYVIRDLPHLHAPLHFLTEMFTIDTIIAAMAKFLGTSIHVYTYTQTMQQTSCTFSRHISTIHPRSHLIYHLHLGDRQPLSISTVAKPADTITQSRIYTLTAHPATDHRVPTLYYGSSSLTNECPHTNSLHNSLPPQASQLTPPYSK